MVTGVESSDLLELDSEKKSFRRKDGFLPEFKGAKKKSIQKNLDLAKADDDKNSEDDQDKPFLAWVLYIPDASNLPKNGKLIEDTIKNQYSIDVPFARIDKTCGHIIFDRNTAKESDVNKLMEKGFDFDDKKISVIEANDKEKNFFFRENGSFLDKIIKKKFNKKVQRSKNQARTEADKKKAVP